MRRVVVLIASVVIVVVAGGLAAGSASAQSTPVEVVEEASGDPCDPCEIHLTGESHITAIPSGVVVSRCADEFEGDIAHDGTGELVYSSASHGAPGCNTVDCLIDPAEAAASITDIVESSDAANMTLRICLGGVTGEVHCNLDVSVDQPATHQYDLSTATLCASGTRRVEGSWQLEDTSVELVHVDPVIEVVNEATRAPCSIATGNCHIHIVGESHVFSNVVGAITSTCEDEFEGDLAHDGTGTVTWVGRAHGAPGCNLVNCTGAEANWPISAAEEFGNGVEHFTVELCLNNGAANLHCNTEVRVNGEDPGAPNYEPHHYVYSATQTCLGGAIRVEGVWESEHDHTHDPCDPDATDEVEFVHNG